MADWYRKEATEVLSLLATVHRGGITPEQTDAVWWHGFCVAFAKGAVYSLLEISDRVWTGEWDIPLSDQMRERIPAANDRLEGPGRRVPDVAFRPLEGEPGRAPGQASGEAALEREMTFIGLVGMIDPPRPEVREAVQTMGESAA